MDKTNEIYDKAAVEIFKQFQRNEDTEVDYNKCDAVWEHPESHAKLFVGGESAASDVNCLKSNDISCIINCRSPNVEDTLHNNPEFTFFRMSIVSSINLDEPQCLWDFFKNFFAFVDKSLEQGKSVLIHCLAGAHRAPTATAAYLLYKTRADVSLVASHLKACRPIVDLRSFGGSIKLLLSLQHALKLLNYPEPPNLPNK